jgi:TolB-like protein/DNA-binding winged helix-turn-helix (wHTH) protein/Tfp pilus assembly protein PilF
VVNVPVANQSGSAYFFLDVTLDLAAERLIRGTSEIRLRPKSFRVLRYLVERPGRLVTREELLQEAWADVTVTDESLTKCIADIRKALSDDAQEIIRTVTRRGFIFQPEVRQVQAPSPPAPQLEPANGGRWVPGRRALLVAGAVVLILGAGLVWLQGRELLLGRRAAFEAIAVLPFESLSEGADQQYLAEGMTQALITGLGQASPLRVIARTSVNQYQIPKKSLHEIAGELKVDLVVEGTIAQSGNRIRVTASLIQVSPEKHLWAHSYEGDVRDAPALQNEIAGAIAGEIQGVLTPRQQSRLARGRAVKPAAQLAYWKARYFLNGRRNRDTARKAVEYSEQAVRIDPDWSQAQAALAMSYVMLGDLGGVPGEAEPRARTAAERAIALDDELAEAHTALSEVLFFHRDWAGTEREARRAISLNPSDALAYDRLANGLAAVGRADESVAAIKRARELDPFSFRINRDVGKLLYFARRYDEALGELRQAGDMQPDSSVVDLWIVKSYLQKGLADEAITMDMRVRRERDGFDAASLDALRAAYARKGSHGYWTTLRELILQGHSSGTGYTYYLAEIETYLDNNHEAFHWLEKHFQDHGGFMFWIKVDPSLDPLRSDPRFSALLERVGLTPSRAATLTWSR